MELKIGEAVMGNIYVSREVKSLCKQGVVVIPLKMIVFQDELPTAKIIFEHGSTQHELALSLFEKPPSIHDMMQVLPYTVK